MWKIEYKDDEVVLADLKARRELDDKLKKSKKVKVMIEVEDEIMETIALIENCHLDDDKGYITLRGVDNDIM